MDNFFRWQNIYWGKQVFKTCWEDINHYQANHLNLRNSLFTTEFCVSDIWKITGMKLWLFWHRNHWQGISRRRDMTLWIHDDESWIFMVNHGHPWWTMDFHGVLWITSVNHGQPWLSMLIHGWPWICMEIQTISLGVQNNQKTFIWARILCLLCVVFVRKLVCFV